MSTVQKINFNINGVDYTVIITSIGDIEDDPETGGGTIPIYYNVTPTPETTIESENLDNAINKYMLGAITSMIKDEENKYEENSDVD